MPTNPLLKDASPEVLARALEREREARKKAEQLMIEKCRELYQSNAEIARTALELKREVQRSHAVFNTAAEGIVIFNKSGIIEWLNPAAEQIFKLQPSEQQINICELLPNVAFCAAKDDCLVSGLRQILGDSNETVGITSQGVEIPLEFVVSEFEANGVTAYSGIIRDLTRRKTLEYKLAQAQKLESIGQLAAGIAHELNTPIQFVDNNTRFLKDAFQSIEEIIERLSRLLEACIGNSAFSESVNEIQQLCSKADLPFLLDEIPLAISQTLEGTKSVSRIVKAMKGFSHLGTENFQEIDLNAALENTLIVSRSEWKYCADLVTDFSPSLPMILGLSGELNQVFINLIVNAAHAMQTQADSGTKGKLTVRTVYDDSNVLVEISDTGSGIPKSIREKVFDPFFTTKGVGKGTGQGLSISYSIVVERHKGAISFDSIEGQGTTFRVSLPRNQ